MSLRHELPVQSIERNAQIQQIIDAVLNDIDIPLNRQKSNHKLFHNNQPYVVNIPVELQGEFMTLLYAELEKYNMQINCKCGIVLPLPHYQILGDNDIELCCHICQLGYVFSNEIVQTKSVKSMLTRFKQIPSCPHLNNDSPGKIIEFKSCMPSKTEYVKSCIKCLPLFENDYLLCSKCNMTIYTRFDHYDNKVYCSNVCMISNNVSI